MDRLSRGERGSARARERGRSRALRICASVLLIPTLAACQLTTPGPTAPPPATLTSAPTLTPVPPTATPVPLAARVNGVDILLSDYAAEIERCRIGYQQVGRDPAVCDKAALQGLIDSVLIEQAAAAAGVTVDAAAVDAAVAQAQTDLGGAEPFAQYLAAIGYSAETYREAMRRDLLRARFTDPIAAAVPDKAEQIHALLILVGTEAEARSILAQLQGGSDFASLALENSLDASSRVGGGDLGWFAHGTLTVPEIEAAAFALQPGGLSDVIATPLGYAIVRVEEREPERLLGPDQIEAAGRAAVEAWLAEQRAGAQIETFVTP